MQIVPVIATGVISKTSRPRLIGAGKQMRILSILYGVGRTKKQYEVKTIRRPCVV